MSLKLLRLLPLALLAAVVGCERSNRPPPAEPAAARDALRTALEAWRKGAAADALKKRQPPMYVIDDEWRSGRRLLDYQVQGDDPYGGDLRCRVVLSLADQRGGSVSKSVVYIVGTNPAVTVTREEEP